MPMSRRPRSSRHRINIHRGYSVDEVARARGVTKGTVRRWTKSGLPAITDQKPLLILGEDLVEFLGMRKAPSQRCSPFECYCVKCRAPRMPAGNMAEYVPLAPKTGNLRAICPVCFRLMHKRIRWDGLEPLRKVLTVTITQPVPSLTE
jgi:hypothetical protein